MVGSVPYSIAWVAPKTPSCQSLDLLETMSFKLCIVVQKGDWGYYEPSDFKCNLWTNLYHKEDNEGEWHPVPMLYKGVLMKIDNQIIYVYGVELVLTCLGKFAFTYRARHKFEPVEDAVWAENFTVDGVVVVCTPIKDYTTWTQEAQLDQITHNVYIGNYQAAIEAPENGFDCLVNTADDAPVFPQQLVQPVIYHRVPLPAGANNVIGDDVICQTVKWLRSMSDKCRKILVHSRAGYGRPGSIMIAFIFANNPNLSFEEAREFVSRRHFVYNHKGLKDALYRLYPRE